MDSSKEIQDQDISISTDSVIQLQSMVNEIKSEVQQLLINNRIMKNDLVELNGVNLSLKHSIYEIEKNLIRSNQYSRRENLEFMNFPESLPQWKLESTLVNIFEAMNLSIYSYDIVAVHRVGKRSRNPRNVIIRFINRKDAIRVMNQRYYFEKEAAKLGFKNVSTVESLCPENRRIFNKCYRLKKENKIKRVSTFNGSIFIDTHVEDDPMLIEHFDDINYFLHESSFADIMSFEDDSFLVNSPKNNILPDDVADVVTNPSI